jgi:hypothetical protein
MWVVFLLLLFPLSVHAEDLGELSANPFNPNSTSNPFGAGSPFKPDGLNNPFSPYGSPFGENKGVGSLYFGTRYNSNLLTEGLR